MKTGTLILLAGILFILLVDVAFYLVARPHRRWVKRLYWGVSCLFALGLLGYHALMPRLTGGEMYFWAGKGILLLLLYYVPRGVYLAAIAPFLFFRRRRWTGRVATIVALLSFLAILHGTTLGRYQYRVEEVKVAIPGLPAAFEGLRVVQLTDLHLGSLGRGYPGIRLLVEKVNALRPDVVALTGDIVNNFATEILPWSDDLRAISARHGKFAVTGNHDYGDYTCWPSPGAKEANLRDLFRNVEACGFRMLNNASHPLAIGGDTLYICGVENWRKSPLPSHGDVTGALRGTNGHVVVLLSHDPVYWREEITRHPVALTLSGHTHAMQMGFQAGRYRWSPAKYFFPEYNGLYARDGRQLYVSRGVGYLGIPGRVGLRPEITVIQLTNSPAS
ncbi:MAG: metallophosphoesterase [Odoribacteraceae bacterium]|nr:metallophosphoesterase [Odoribacteraceae bacterium]